MRALFLKLSVLTALILISCCLLYSGGITKHLYFFNQGFRLNDLPKLTKAYELTHQPMLAYMSDTKPNFEPIENWGDDLGMYYIVPAVQRLFATSLYRAYLAVYGGCIVLGFILGAFGIKLLVKDKRVLWLLYVYLALIAFVMFFVLDNYVLAYLVTSLIPLLIRVKQKYLSDKKTVLPVITLLFTGLLVGIANSFRVYSGWGVVLIIVTALVAEKQIPPAKKLLFILALFIITPVCKTVISSSLNQRNEWIKSHNDVCLPNNNITRHVIWHNLYTGLGIIQNKYGITWSDENAFAAARKNNPDLSFSYYNVTQDYDKAIKAEYFNVIKTDPVFVLKTLMLKLFYCLLLAIIFFNYGIFLFKKSSITYKNFLPILAGIIFYMLPGILVYPYPMYVLGALNIFGIASLLLYKKALTGKE